MNIPLLFDLCEGFRIVDNTSEPETIFLKDQHVTQIRPNRYWNTDAIESLINGSYRVL